MGRELVRSYSMTDSEMLQQSKTFIELAKVDIDELTAVEPSINLSILNSMDEETTSCINDFSSVESKNSISIAKANVDRTMTKCRNEIQLFFFHCKRTFPDIPSITIEFGKREMEKARLNPEKMIRLMNLIITTYDKPSYKEKLDSRLTANFKDRLEELKQELLNASAMLGVAKANRPVETEARIMRFNAVWDFTRNISEIAKIAFRNSFAKQQQYKLYDTPTHKPSQPDQSDNIKTENEEP